MSCDICGRENCCPMFHRGKEQVRFERVIEAFDRARAIRAEVIAERDEEERQQEEAEENGQSNP